MRGLRGTAYVLLRLPLTTALGVNIKMKKITKPWLYSIPTIFGLATMILAYLHYGQIENPNEYRQSALIKYEFIFLFLGVISLLAVCISFLVNLMKKDWVAFGHSLLAFILGFLSLSYAMHLDNPTLVYMT
jgi:hypothetical protein